MQLQRVVIDTLPQALGLAFPSELGGIRRHGVLTQFPAFHVRVTWLENGKSGVCAFVVCITSLEDMPDFGYSWSIFPATLGESDDSGDVRPDMLHASTEGLTSLEEALDVAVSEVVRYWRVWM